MVKIYVNAWLKILNFLHKITLDVFLSFSFSLPFFVTFSGEPNTPKPWRSPWLNYRTTSSGTSTAAEEGGGGGVRGAGVGGGLGGEGPQWIIDNPAQFSGRIPSWVRRERERERERERCTCTMYVYRKLKIFHCSVA